MAVADMAGVVAVMAEAEAAEVAVEGPVSEALPEAAAVAAPQ